MRAHLLVWCLAVAVLGAVSCSRGGSSSADEKPAPSSLPLPQTAPTTDGGTPSGPCPDTISVAQSLSTVAAGWESFEDDAPTQLMSVGVFDGHPREQASLVPDSDTESSGRRVATWRLAKDSPRRYWLACYYDRSRIALTRMLPTDITRVDVTRDVQVTVGGLPAVTDIKFK